MTGFELVHNDRTVSASIEKGVIVVYLSKTETGIGLSLQGLDLCIGQHVKWFESAADKGDEIKVRVVDVKKPSAIISATPQLTDTRDDKMAEYSRLKKYLEKEGLI